MNKEIKFRGMYNNDWVYGTYHYSADLKHHYILSREVFTSIKDKYYSLHDKEVFYVDGKSVSQYTGIKDKNGKEIYEGDIITFVDITTDNYIKNKNHETCIVKWVNHRAAFHPQDISENYKNGHYIHFWEQIELIEVIGNIYKNSELLTTL